MTVEPQAPTADPALEAKTEKQHQENGNVENTDHQETRSVDTLSNEVSVNEPSLSVQPESTQEPTEAPESAQEIAEPQVQPVDPLLLKEQFKFMAQLIRNMKKKKDAVIFLKPVDPVALNIPTYFQVIKHPMDISTIEKKLGANQYESISDMKADFDLMFQNCYTFNGTVSAVSVMAKNCEIYFIKEMEKLPMSLKLNSEKKKKSINQAFDLYPPPKRTARPGSREFAGLRSKKSLSRDQQLELKFCSVVMKELVKKSHAPYNLPFLQPVDPIALGIPTYFDVIKNPMDLSTMRKKLDLWEYETADEFEADMRLMINNCFTFNPQGTDVYNLGAQLENVFNLKWAEKQTWIAQQSESKRQSFYEGDSSDDYDDDDDAAHIQMLKTQIQLLQNQIQAINEKRNKRKKRRSLSATNHPSASYLPSTPTIPSVPKKPKQKRNIEKKKKRPFPQSSDDEREPEEITYEQKRELSDNINILPPEKLPVVLDIIKSNTAVNSSEEEIELDIDSLDKSVLWKLYKFVKKHTQPEKKIKTDHDEKVDSSSSSEDSDDSEASFLPESTPMEVEPVPKEIPKPVEVPKPVEQPKSVDKPKLGDKKPKKPDNAFIPFRTEKGDFTSRNYTGQKQAALFQKPKPVVQQPKPQSSGYNELLASAWDTIEAMKPLQEIVEKVISPERPQVSLDLDELLGPVIPTAAEPQVQKTIDIQGPMDEIDRFHESIPQATAEDLQKIKHEIYKQQAQEFEKQGNEPAVLNLDTSDEEGLV
ncbi:Bromodomain-containing protein [Gorgonomyces haynaldii]|nr:Bromodomain-containing protein [Gorgonomyces haynaldii]